MVASIVCRSFFVCCLGLMSAIQAASQPLFTAVPRSVGINVSPTFISRSYIFADYDNDGWPDQYRTEAFGAMRIALLHNEGGRRFVDQTYLVDAADLPIMFRGGGGIAADYDNDGDLDLFLPNGSFLSIGTVRNVLLRNDRGRFTDVSLQAGLIDAVPTDNAIWLDYDRDGYLDLYTGNISAPDIRNILYRNQGDGSFLDVTEEAGLLMQFHPELGGSNGGMIAADFTEDGWPDLYLAVFEGTNRLFVNNGDGSFRDATTTEVGDPGQAFHSVAGDINNDGRLDIFQAAGGNERTVFRSVMLLNLGDGVFLDVTEASGLQALGAVNAEGVGMVDIDNDGDLDLFVNVAFTRHFIFLNDGAGSFVDHTARSGITTALTPTSFGDYDRDGWLDGLTRDGLFRNNGNENHWLRVALTGLQSNRSGIGSRLHATAEDLQQVRQILGGYGYNQGELVAHFGLGARTQVDRLEIRWPSGQVDILNNIPADQQIRVIEGKGSYHSNPPTAWAHDLPDTALAGEPLAVNLAVRPTLYDPLAPTVRLTADLRPLGGKADQPLLAQGDGSYVLQGQVIVPQSPGLQDVHVDILEESVALGTCWSRLSKTVNVLPTQSPAPDMIVLADGLENGWQLESTNLVWDLRQDEDPYQGDAFMQIDGGARWNLRFVAPDGVDSGAYQAIRFAFLPVNTHVLNRDWSMFFTVNDNRLKFAGLEGGAEWSLGSNGVNTALAQWQIAEIPLHIFAVRGPLRSFSIQGLTFEGKAYLDDIRLVAASPASPATFVEWASQPLSFGLGQNYPNPFNSGTAIRYTLPQATDMALTLYNLAGQKVRTLAHGRRAAGTYTVRWDGRDDDGRALASGVYFYRLNSGPGAMVETRKLILVK